MIIKTVKWLLRISIVIGLIMPAGALCLVLALILFSTLYTLEWVFNSDDLPVLDASDFIGLGCDIHKGLVHLLSWR
jgi:hypothetical protein|tara:strand:- start:204 stop:431 length:228 start_codon:yes stop_codon:yes gene_type:complete